jgi:hypothetical protein
MPNTMYSIRYKLYSKTSLLRTLTDTIKPNIKEFRIPITACKINSWMGRGFDCSTTDSWNNQLWILQAVVGKRHLIFMLGL